VRAGTVTGITGPGEGVTFAGDMEGDWSVELSPTKIPLKSRGRNGIDDAVWEVRFMAVPRIGLKNLLGDIRLNPGMMVPINKIRMMDCTSNSLTNALII